MAIYLHHDVRFVAGPMAGALYDLRDGRVHAVPPALAALLGRGGNNDLASIASADEQAWLTGLVAGGLTQSEPSPVQPLAAALTGRPKLLWLELTGRCNYTCQHCYAESDPTPQQTLPSERWLQIISEARAAGFPAIQFTGGDPFMHPQLLDFVAAARAAKYDLIEVYTNGSMLSERALDRLQALGAQLAMSFYSYRPEIYAAITNSDGFERAVAGIRGAAARGIPVRIGLIEMAENKNDIAATVEFLQDLGVAAERIQLDGVRPSGRGAALQPTACGGGGNIVPLDRLARADKQGPPIWRRPMGLPQTFKVNNQQAEWNSCWSGEIVVNPDGDVFPCIFSRGVALGNVAKNSLAQLLQAPPLRQAWQTTLGDCDDCSVCEFRFACFDCRALTANLAPSLTAKPPSCIYNPQLAAFDWPRWLAQQPDLKSWLTLRPLRNLAFTVVTEDENGVLVAAHDRAWQGRLSFLQAAVLDAADGTTPLQSLLSSFPVAEQSTAAAALVTAAWELEARGLLSLQDWAVTPAPLRSPHA